MKKISNLLILLALLLMCLSLTACGATKVDVVPYLSVNYTGYNGNGTAHVDFDYADFEYSIMSQWKEGDRLEKLADLTAVEVTLSFDPAVTENLSNGDTVTVKVSVNQELAKEKGYSFADMEKTFTVEGLPDPIEIDPFAEDIFGEGKMVDFSMSGIDPFVILSLYNNADRSDPVSHITYQADNDWNLKNGDTITITATMDEAYAAQGYLLTRTELAVSVDGFDRYASAASDLTNDVLQSISDRAYQECVNGQNVNIFDGTNNLTPWGASFENTHVGGTALLAVNQRLDEPYSFLLVPVYKTITTDEWYDMAAGMNTAKTWNDVFAYYTFTDIVVHADGSVSYNESYVDMQGNFTDAAAADSLYLNQLRSNYAFVEVPMP